jgi:hypothetical protein
MGVAAGTVVEFPRHPRVEAAEARFRVLLGETGWGSLPEATRRRFSRHLADGEIVTYTGEIVEMRMSPAGWLLAQIARLIGAPLPLYRDIMVPATVAVMADGEGQRQFWTRIYGQRAGFPQVIRSAKRFAGPTGLEEHLGHGLTMLLVLSAEDGVLRFRSAGYVVRLLGVAVLLPRWLGLPHCTVSHVDCGHDTFAFVLDVRQRFLGELIHQTGLFVEQAARG